MSKNILIIEDDETLREGLELILRDENYNIQAIPENKHLKKVLLEFTPDLYLIDYRLPGADGLSITKRIRQTENKTKAPIIIISASGQDLYERAKLAGANAFLRKPFEIKELVQLIRKLFAEKPSL